MIATIRRSVVYLYLFEIQSQHFYFIILLKKTGTWMRLNNECFSSNRNLSWSNVRSLLQHRDFRQLTSPNRRRKNTGTRLVENLRIFFQRLQESSFRKTEAHAFCRWKKLTMQYGRPAGFRRSCTDSCRCKVRANLLHLWAVIRGTCMCVCILCAIRLSFSVRPN